MYETLHFASKIAPVLKYYSDIMEDYSAINEPGVKLTCKPYYASKSCDFYSASKSNHCLIKSEARR